MPQCPCPWNRSIVSTNSNTVKFYSSCGLCSALYGRSARLTNKQIPWHHCVSLRGGGGRLTQMSGRWPAACWTENKGAAISIKEGRRNASRIHRSPAHTSLHDQKWLRRNSSQHGARLYGLDLCFEQALSNGRQRWSCTRPQTLPARLSTVIHQARGRWARTKDITVYKVTF